LVKTQK